MIQVIRYIFVAAVLIVLPLGARAASEDCSGHLSRPFNQKLVTAARNGRLAYLLLPIESRELPRVLTELTTLGDSVLPEPHSEKEFGLFPITHSFPEKWTETVAFGQLDILSEKEIEQVGSHPLLVSPLRRVYMIIDVDVLGDGEWSIFNRWALEGGKRNLYTEENSGSTPKQIEKYFREIAEEQVTYSRVIGVISMKNGIPVSRLRGFLAPGGEPLLTAPIREAIRDGKIQVPLFETDSLPGIDSI